MSLNELGRFGERKEMPNYLPPESENCLRQHLFSWYPTILMGYFFYFNFFLTKKESQKGRPKYTDDQLTKLNSSQVLWIV